MRFIYYLFLGFIFLSNVFPQNIYINEFLASNTRDYPEMHDFDDYTDWIELYNSDNQEQSLDGFFLTDDFDDPFKWKITEGAIIGPQSYFIIWADDYNNGPGHTYLRPYYPWDDFTTKNYHTNFKLSKSGEQLGLFLANQVNNDTLIYKNSEWKYYCGPSIPDLNWMNNDFDDSEWNYGIAELGYGDGDEETIVEYGPDSDNKYITTYFRHSFIVGDPENINVLVLNIKRDDGAVVFLNGNEINRSNMPLGVISNDTYAASSVYGSDEETFFRTDLSISGLILEQNVIAVEIHKRTSSNSDISFDLELVSQNYSNSILVDSVRFGEQITDVSQGRLVDDNSWAFFGEPTPGHVNNTPASFDLDVASSIISSSPTGFYNNIVMVDLSVESNEQIFYTLDGTRPGTNSTLYNNPISIENTTVLKARAFSENKLPGEIFMSTYFINEENHLPTVSLIAEPETLWDEDIGIYINEFKQREIPVNIQYFNDNSEIQFSASAGARLGGENIWMKPQKPFTIYTRGRFGQDYINYQLFDNKQIANFSRFVFRNGGDDWEETLIRDPMTESIVAGMMRCGYMAYTPSSLFLNGNYWGIHNIREKFNKTYFFENYGADPNNIDHLEYGSTLDGIKLLIVEGDFIHYNNMIDFITSNDLNNIENYLQVMQWMDIDSFIDHVIMTAYCANTSWKHNREWWRPRSNNGKWKWLIVDLDRGFNVFNSNRNLLDDLKEDYELFNYLLQSDIFYNRFIQRSAAHLNNTFTSNRINNIVDSLSFRIAPEMHKHVSRWSNDGGISSVSDWEEELNEIKQFSSDRSNNVIDHFIEEFDIDGVIELNLRVEPTNSGSIELNGVSVIGSGQQSGYYFKNQPISISVSANPGYEFIGWEDNLSDSTRLVYDCSIDTSFTAVFESSNHSILPSVISENMTLNNTQAYIATTDILVPSSVTLTISEGVNLKMMRNTNLIIEGQLIMDGSEQNFVKISSFNDNEDNRWGAICFNNSEDTSSISYTKISGASNGFDPISYYGAISSINSNIIIDHTSIEDVEFPVLVKGGSVIASGCSFSSNYICDFINVKDGNALIENSIFYGSNAVDTDAIDFDNVHNGIIKNNKIYNFIGSNSDGIDIGEESQNILIESNMIFHSGDKGVSIGQNSLVTLRKNLIVGCKIGIAAKDSSNVNVINNTFFKNDTSISAYEKNQGSGGGSVESSNNIISNSTILSVFMDEESSLNINYSLSDTDVLEGVGNIFADPSFINQNIYNFELDNESICIDAGDPYVGLDEDGSISDIGSYYIYSDSDYPFIVTSELVDQLVINEFLASNNTINVDEEADYDDWVEIYNPTNYDINIAGLYLTDDLEQLNKWSFPDSIVLSNDFLVIWCDDSDIDTGLHTNFKLDSDGEEIALVKSNGTTIIDYISFGTQISDQSYGRIPDGGDQWSIISPTPGSSNNNLLVGSNTMIPSNYQLFSNYPNPFNAVTIINYDVPIGGVVSIYIFDLMGRKIKTLISKDNIAGKKTVIWEARGYTSGLYIIKMVGKSFIASQKVLLLK